MAFTIMMTGTLLLGLGNSIFNLTEPVQIAQNAYIFKDFERPEAKARVWEKDSRDGNRPLAIQLMIGGDLVLLIGVGVFIFALDQDKVMEERDV